MKQRVGIVVAELGIPSEVWILRQCAEFQHIEPVFLYWKMHETPTPLPDGIERRHFREPFARKRSLGQRVLRRLGFASAVLPNRRQREDIRSTIEAANVDAVLCHFAWSGIPVAAALEGSKPIVWQVHGRDVSTQMLDRAYRRAVARTLPRIDHLVAVGRFQIELLKPFGLGPRHSVIPCGAPLSLFGQDDTSVRRAADLVRFISVGRLSEEKGVMQTLSAFEKVAVDNPNVELVIIGGGPLRAELDQAVAASPFGRKVRLLGQLPPNKVAEALRSAHIYVQHSRMVNGWIEGFGVTLTEAGASGLPLVVSRLGGIVDQVREGENGFMFDPDDVDTQAALMTRLSQDEALRRAMGEAARNVAQTFDSRLMTGKLEAVLLEAISNRNRRVADS